MAAQKQAMDQTGRSSNSLLYTDALFAKALVVVRWGNGTPAYKLAISIRKRARNFAGVDAAFESRLICIPAMLCVFRACEPPPHAPATGTGSTRTEKGCEVRPAAGRERVNLKVEVGLSGRR